MVQGSLHRRRLNHSTHQHSSRCTCIEESRVSDQLLHCNQRLTAFFQSSKSLAPAPAISSSYVLVPSAVPTSGFQGALRGTRLTAMDQDTGGNICLFYQYADGSLRYQFQNLARVWQGSTDLQVKDAMQGTPLAAVSTWNNGSVIVSALHLLPSLTYSYTVVALLCR